MHCLSDHPCDCGCGEFTLIAPKTYARYGIVRGQPNRFVNGHNGRVLTGALAHQWAGGSFVTSGGYVNVTVPDHPRSHRGYVFEHILIAETVLGHYLDEKHPVHHVNGNGRHNVNSNLVVCEDQAYHLLLHRRQRALDATGNANAHKCCLCRSYDNQDDIRTCITKRGCFRASHRSCERESTRDRRAAIRSHAGDPPPKASDVTVLAEHAD